MVVFYAMGDSVKTGPTGSPDLHLYIVIMVVFALHRSTRSDAGPCTLIILIRRLLLVDQMTLKVCPIIISM